MTPGEPTRVLRVLTRPNLGGPTRQAIALWHEHRALGLRTLLVTGATDPSERALEPAAHGIERLDAAVALQRGRSAEGWVELPELGRAVRPLRDRRAFAALRALMRACAPDVVHTHTSKAGLLGRRAAFAAAVPVVAHTFHGHVLRDYFGALWSRLLARSERALATRTDVLFAVSDSCADELAALGIAPRARFTVLPPAVPLPAVLGRDEARRRLDVPADRWCVAGIGRLVPIKRMQDFVAMVAADAALAGDVHGDGPEAARLRALAAARAAGRLRILAGSAALPSLLAAYDALVLPSVREGCPLVAIEAFAAGVPVVGYDVAGVRDVLARWGRGVLVPEADGPPGLLRAVRALRTDAALRARCVADSTAELGRFHPARVAAAMASAYSAAAVTMR